MQHLEMSSDEKREFTFLWEIENFSFCTQKKGECLDSPVFKAESLDDTSWYLRLYPRGYSRSGDEWMGCFLRRCEDDDGPSDIKCEFEIQIISEKEDIICSNKGAHKFIKNDGRGWSNFSNKSIQSNNIPKVLKLRCNIKSNAQKRPLRSESLGVSEINIDQCSFIWLIKSLNSDCSEVIKLPYPGTSLVEISVQAPEDDVTITIRRVEGATKALSVMCGITLLDLEGGKHDSRKALHFFEAKESSTENDDWEFPNFLKKSKLNCEKEKYLLDDCFELKCEIAISNGKLAESVEKKTCDSLPVESPPPVTGAVNVLERLYKDKIHADVKLLVDNETVIAHKNILSVQSPVFMAMFDTDMVENETGSVKIPDFDFETVNSLLEYMYTGTVNKLDYEVATKLIVAADKYQVLCLKERCAQFIKSVLSHANVCEALTIADLIQHEVLKTASVNYIKDNSEGIFYSKEWQNVIDNNIQLATETVSKVSKLVADDRKKT